MGVARQPPATRGGGAIVNGIVWPTLELDQSYGMGVYKVKNLRLVVNHCLEATRRALLKSLD